MSPGTAPRRLAAVVALVVGVTSALLGIAPATPAAAAPVTVAAADGGTIATTLLPAANAFPTGSGAQRQISRDCGHSVEVPGGRSLWLFCDTVVYDDVTGPGPAYTARTAFVPSGTAGLGPIVKDPSPTNPVRITEAAHPSLPRGFITSTGVYGTAKRPITCDASGVALAWTGSLVTLPGTSTVVAVYQDHCGDAAAGYPTFDTGIAELTLPDVADGDSSAGRRLTVSRQYGSVGINPTPGRTNEIAFADGGVIDGQYLYLYGPRPTQFDCSNTCRIVREGSVEVARVTWADAGYRDISKYRYYTGTGSDPWSADPNAAVNILPSGTGIPAGDGLDVKWQPQIGRYVMVHTDTGLGAAVGADVRTAPTPWGPWSDVNIIEPDTSSAHGRPAKACGSGITCRTFELHPELSGGSTLWFSYVREGDLATADGRAATVNGSKGMTVRLGSVPLSSLPVPAAGGTVTPGRPTGVTATAGDRRASVTWTAPTAIPGSPVLGYRITPYRGSTALRTIAVSGAGTSATVPGLDNTVAHTFTVAAVTAAGTGQPSAASAAVTPKGAPRAPVDVTAEPGDGAVTVDWTAPTNTGGAAITGYRVTPYVDGVAQPARALTQTATSKVISSLANGTTYTFTVQAVTSLGTSAESAPSGTAMPYGAASAPTITEATPGNGTVTLRWSAPTSNGGSSITGYRVTPSVDGVAQAPRELTGTATAKVIGELTNGRSHTFRVQAVNARGAGAASAASAAVTPRTTSEAPTGLTVANGDRSAVLSWTAPTDTGGTPVTGYEVTPFADGRFLTPVDFTGTQTTRTITGLTNGTLYRFVVRARTAAGIGASSSFSPAATPRTVPGAPTAVTATAGNGRVTVRYTAPTSTGGARLTGYRVTTYSGSTVVRTTDFQSGIEQAITGLANGTSYTFGVQAINEAGAGAVGRSGAAQPRTVPDAPGTPVAEAGNGSAQLSWSAPTADGGARVTGYVVTPFRDGTTEASRTFSTAATDQVIAGLTNGANYRFAVRAVNEAGTGASTTFSNQVKPAVPVTRTAPGAPAGITVEAGDGRVTLRFSAPANDGGSAITGYRITPYVGSTPAAVRTTSTATTQVVTGLTNGTAHMFVVEAVNAVGTGAAGRSGSVTPRTVAGAPTGVTARAASGSATVGWTAPAATGGAPITGYLVTPWAGGTAQPSRTFTTPDTSQVIDGLTNGTAYRFSVRAVNAAGAGTSSGFSGTVTPQASTTASSHVPYASWGAMVDGLFRTILERTPTASERSTWTGRLSAGAHAPGDLVVALRGLDDQVSIVDPVGRLYRAYFLRPPDAGGLSYWVAQRRRGRSLGWVSQQFARSREFTTTYGSLSDDGFMDLVYEQVLERRPEASGKAYWVGQLRSGKKTRGTVMIGFSEAAEYRARYGSTVEVALAHLRLLGRAPSTAETRAWVDAVAGGATTASRYTALVRSSEHASRVR